VGGIVGTTRFHYDVWGDAVNVAARMESSGEPGRIQLAPGTHALVGATFQCTPRGSIVVKGKGEMETWWLEQEGVAGISGTR
jgi:class 3 adenylate cyclase